MLASTPSNATFIRPSRFYINGFSNVPHVKYYYVFLCFAYVVTVFGNSFIMLVIYIDRTLHTPKYIVVFNLAVADFSGSTALIPKVIDTFLFEAQYISYNECLSYMFFVYLFSCVQSLTLVALAYDRLIAICFPLRYHAIVTKSAMIVLIIITWGIAAAVCCSCAALITRLSFCKSLVINSFFCDHGPTYKLACNDASINNIMAWIAFLVIFVLPVILITITYVCIGITLVRIASGEERIKAMKTCTSHLMLVAIFYLPTFATNIAAVATYIHPNARIINSSLSSIMPPMLNPIIYTLKTEEVMVSIKKLYRRSKVTTAKSKK
ncbi:olfactory receptor 146-like [Megalops cyprinoides]|uniref:olfactory receptor 146-like n=1 Tax=Megalops cyprinoides TaxID=118141 RepID=UPI0018647491|nr:olfactory receptor 146-like [Megalops cyprinoides]